MERGTKGFSSTQTKRVQSSARLKTWSDRADSTNPASRRANRSLRAAEFEQFARAAQLDLNPRGSLEQVVVRQAIRSAWRLKANLEIEAELVDDLVESSKTSAASRSLEVAMMTLELLRGRRDESTRHAPADPDTDSARGNNFREPMIAPNEWPIVPVVELEDVDAEAVEETPIWSERLVYDFTVSEDSPIVKGTWITVSHVVTLIVDGATWADILRSHPELTEEDIRLCVAFAVADEDAEL